MSHIEEEVPLVSEVKVFGFWIYLMTDLIIFAVLFATFVTMRSNTFGGPSGQELFKMPYVLAETMALLLSSFTCSLGNLAVIKEQKKPAIYWFMATFALGIVFLVLEIYEFSEFARNGASWKRSGFLSSYFALVGTHGFHVSLGLLWMLVMMFRIGFRGILTPTVSRTFRMVLFWHFLDIVWIFIFTIVYATGHLL